MQAKNEVAKSVVPTIGSEDAVANMLNNKFEGERNNGDTKESSKGATPDNPVSPEAKPQVIKEGPVVPEVPPIAQNATHSPNSVTPVQNNDPQSTNPPESSSTEVARDPTNVVTTNSNALADAVNAKKTSTNTDGGKSPVSDEVTPVSDEVKPKLDGVIPEEAGNQPQQDQSELSIAESNKNSDELKKQMNHETANETHPNATPNMTAADQQSDEQHKAAELSEDLPVQPSEPQQIVVTSPETPHKDGGLEIPGRGATFAQPAEVTEPTVHSVPQNANKDQSFRSDSQSNPDVTQTAAGIKASLEHPQTTAAPNKPKPAPGQENDVAVTRSDQSAKDNSSPKPFGGGSTIQSLPLMDRRLPYSSITGNKL